MLISSAAAWHHKILSGVRQLPQAVTARTRDGVDICVQGLSRDCSVVAAIDESGLVITAVRNGHEAWSRRYEIPNLGSVQIEKTRWYGTTVCVSVRLQ